MPNNEKCATIIYVHEQIKSASSEQKYIHKAWYRPMEFVMHLQHEYTQITVGLFHENLTPIHCSAVVCICVLSIFL